MKSVTAHDVNDCYVLQGTARSPFQTAINKLPVQTQKCCSTVSEKNRKVKPAHTCKYTPAHSILLQVTPAERWYLRCMPTVSWPISVRPYVSRCNSTRYDPHPTSPCLPYTLNLTDRSPAPGVSPPSASSPQAMAVRLATQRTQHNDHPANIQNQHHCRHIQQR